MADAVRSRVCAVIVTRNSALFVAKALDSIHIQDYPAVETVVVDNASTDGITTLIHNSYPWVHLIETGRNTGFAGGNNIGMKAHPADYYILLNPDAVLAPGWVTTMVTYLDTHPETAVAGAKVFYGDRTRLQHAGGMFRDNALTYHIGDGETDRGQYDEPREVDYVLGAAMVLRATVARELGYLPEAYFPAYFEEADYCFQVRAAGYKVMYIPGAVAYHDEQHSGSGKLTLRYVRRYHRHRYLFAIRNFRTRETRARFVRAERAWRRSSARGIRAFLLLTYCKLANWRAFPHGLWLFRAP